MAGFEHKPHGNESRPSAEHLTDLREAILLWAEERRRDAHSLEARAVGIAQERYTAGEGHAVPFFSERVRITPIQSVADKFRDMYLYFPYDNLQSERDSQGIPPVIFISLISAEDIPMRYVVSRRKMAAFLPKDNMHVSMEHFENGLTGIGIEEAFIDNPPPPSLTEKNSLEELLSYLQDKNSYRITAQPAADAA